MKVRYEWTGEFREVEIDEWFLDKNPMNDMLEPMHLLVKGSSPPKEHWILRRIETEEDA